MAYTRLIRLYYRKEQPIPADMGNACRLIRANSKQERQAVQDVLNEFFDLRDDGWHQKTCDENIDRFKAGEPEREAKKANEETRLRRHREERAELFKKLTDAGQHAAWNIGIKELREMVKSLPSPRTATQPETAPATPATANQPPIPNHQSPIPSIKVKNNGAVAPELFGPDEDLLTPEERLAASVIVDAIPPPRGDAGAEVRAVFTYWQQATGHTRAHLDKTREKNIKARLKDGYSVEDLCRAVDGCKLSPYHMGKNDTGTVHDDIELICREASRIDKFLVLCQRGPSNQPSRTTNQQTTMDNLQAYLEKNG